MPFRPPKVVAVALLLAVATLPATAQESGGGRSSALPTAVPAGLDLRTRAALPADSGDVLLRLDGDGAVSRQAGPAAALLSVRNHSDTAAWLQSMSAATRAAARPGAAAPMVLRPARDAAASDEGADAEAGEGRFAFPFAGGDLDGDGVGDVLVERGVFSDESVASGLEARRGSDGAVLWSLPVSPDGGYAVPLEQDVSGDGIDDLLVAGFEVHDTQFTSDDRGNFTYTAAYTETLGLLSGATGQRLWSRAYPGRIEESERAASATAGVVTEYAYRLRSSGIATLALSGGDLTGDGLGDLVLNNVGLDVDLAGAYTDVVVAGEDRGSLTITASTAAVVVAGDTGEVVHESRVTGPSAISLLQPAGELGGGAGEDLLWTTATYRSGEYQCYVAPVASRCTKAPQGTSSFQIEALDGVSRRPLWRTSVASAATFLSVLGEDLDGDGVGDLSVDAYGIGDGGLLRVLSGATGATLWEATGNIFAPSLIGSAPGPGGSVVTVMTLEDVQQDGAGPLDSGRSEWTLRTDRRAGATGAVLSTRSEPVPSATPPPGDDPVFGNTSGFITFVGLGRSGDTDGDAAEEAYAFSLSTAYVLLNDGTYREAHRSTLRMQDLTDGASTFRDDVAKIRGIFPYADVDGDSLTDIAAIDVEIIGDEDADEPDFRLDITVFRANDRNEHWQVRGLRDQPRPSGDLDGRAGEELLTTGAAAGNGAADEVRVLNGKDLSLRWRS